MKTTLVILFILCAAAAFGQTGVAVLSNQPQIIEPASHALHAEQHSLATETPLVGGGAYTYAQGERPLWEFGSPNPAPAPLGDVARAFRKEKQSARKAESSSKSKAPKISSIKTPRRNPTVERQLGGRPAKFAALRTP